MKDPENRFEEIRNIHEDAYLAKADYIPICIQVKNSEAVGISRWEAFLDPSKALMSWLNTIKQSRQVKSDWIPNITIYYQYVLIPSLFGAKLYNAEGYNPIIKPFIDDDWSIKGLFCKDIEFSSDLIEKAVKHFSYLMERTHCDVVVIPPNPISPLDQALDMRGGDFYCDLVLEPELCLEFLMFLTELLIKQVKLFKRICNEPNDRHTTCRGQSYPGLRVAADSLVNLSPDMIRRFAFPVFERLATEFGRILVHYCTRPTPCSHVLPVLAECPYVTGVDNWQGYKTLFGENEKGMMQEQLSICTDISAANLLEELQEPFFTEVRRKGGRGLLLTVHADSVDEGKQIYDRWLEYTTIVV